MVKTVKVVFVMIFNIFRGIQKCNGNV